MFIYITITNSIIFFNYYSLVSTIIYCFCSISKSTKLFFYVVDLLVVGHMVDKQTQNKTGWLENSENTHPHRHTLVVYILHYNIQSYMIIYKYIYIYIK